MVEDRLQVGHHRRLGDHRAAREAGAARGVLQVGELVGRGRRRQLVGGLERHELVHGAGERQRQAVGGLAQEADEVRRGEGGDRLAVAHELAQMADVDLAAAEVDGGGQRHRHQAGVLAGVEHHREVGVGVGHQGQALAAAERRQALRQLQGARPQIAVGQAGGQGAAAVVEIEAGVSRGGVVQGLGQGREVGTSQRNPAGGSCRSLREGHRLERRAVLFLCQCEPAGYLSPIPPWHRGMPPPTCALDFRGASSYCNAGSRNSREYRLDPAG